MRLPKFALNALRRWVCRQSWKPYEHLTGYMNRWWLIKPAWYTLGLGVRVHQVLRSDADRHLHNHPWWNLSVILDGGYDEEVPVRQDPLWLNDGGQVEAVYTYTRQPGDVIYRPRTLRHRLKLAGEKPVLTLFVTGPRDQNNQWGFYKPTGWIHWTRYLNDKEKN